MPSMPYVKNQGIRIHYRVEGDGPALVLQHGFTSSGELLRRYGYTEALKNDYRVISIDARGHGSSDKPYHPEAYRLSCLVDDVLALLDKLNIKCGNWKTISCTLSDKYPKLLSQWDNLLKDKKKREIYYKTFNSFTNKIGDFCRQKNIKIRYT